MNLFILDLDHFKNAEYHCNSHCVKLQTEAAQMASAAHHLTGGKGPYRLTHANHPVTKWVRHSLSNYNWACEYGLSLCYEYSYRYGKEHATERVLNWLYLNKPNIQDLGLTRFALAMPDQYKTDDAINSYRHFYKIEKRYDKNGKYMLVYKNRTKPEWIDV